MICYVVGNLNTGRTWEAHIHISEMSHCQLVAIKKDFAAVEDCDNQDKRGFYPY